MKKYLRKKTDVELGTEHPLTLTRIADLRPYDAKRWWSCDLCKTIFETSDYILYKRDSSDREEYRCPLKRGFLGRTCGTSLGWAEPSYWLERYVFPTPPTEETA